MNHQVALAQVAARDNIREMFSADFRSAKLTCIVENLFEDGEWAILEWRDPEGRRGSGFLHIVGGAIQLQRGHWDRLTFART